MTRDERNAKISELRERKPDVPNLVDVAYDEVVASPQGFWLYRQDDNVDWTQRKWGWHPMDWHADANWPTLLREMPSPDVYRARGGGSVVTPNAWFCSWDCHHEHNVGAYGDNDVSEAVCEAWLQWKQPALGKGAE